MGGESWLDILIVCRRHFSGGESQNMILNLLARAGGFLGRSGGCGTHEKVIDMNNEKNPGCLGYIGDYTTQLYGDYNKPL